MHVGHSAVSLGLPVKTGSKVLSHYTVLLFCGESSLYLNNQVSSCVILYLPCEHCEARNSRRVIKGQKYVLLGNRSPSIPCCTMLLPWSSRKCEAEHEAFCWLADLPFTDRNSWDFERLPKCTHCQEFEIIFQNSGEPEQDVQELLWKFEIMHHQDFIEKDLRYCATDLNDRKKFIERKLK